MYVCMCLQRKEVNKENIQKKLRKKTYQGIDVEFRDKPTSQPTSPAPKTPRVTEDGSRNEDPSLRRTDSKNVPPVPTSPKPTTGSGQPISRSRQPVSSDARQSLPPPPPTPAGSARPPAPPPPGYAPPLPPTGPGRTPAPPTTAPAYAPPLPPTPIGRLPAPPPIMPGYVPPPPETGSGQTMNNNEPSLPLPPPIPPPLSVPGQPVSGRGSTSSETDSLPPPPTPPGGISGVPTRRNNRLSRLTMPPPRMSVCIIDSGFDALDENEELAMPAPPPIALAPPPPPPPPPVEANLPPPPPMESGFALKSEPTRQPSQKKHESRGDLLAAIRKGRSPNLPVVHELC